MRKVYIEVKVKLVVEMEEEQEVNDFIQEMDYSFSSTQETSEVVDTEILDYEVIDSK